MLSAVVGLNHLADYAQALAHTGELIQVGQDGGDRQLVCWGLKEQGRARLLMGQWDDARAALTTSAELADAVQDQHSRVEVRGLLGQLCLRQGDLEDALAHFRQGMAISDQHHARWLNAIPVQNGLAEFHLTAVERANGADRSHRLKEGQRACQTALGLGKSFRGGLPEAMRLQGTYEWLRGKPAAARQWWQRSISLAEELNQPYDLGMTHLEVGRRLNDTSHLQSAEAIFAEIGAEWDLAQARDALVETRR